MNAKNPISQIDQAPKDPKNRGYSLEHPEVIEALEEYQIALEENRPPNRQHMLGRFPGITEKLDECLQAIEMLHNSGLSAKSAGAGDEAAPTGIEFTGEPLGDFRLIREIGRGGMGVVYEAEQRSLGRRVALKVLPFAATLDTRHLQRFKNEAQAAACLHHPHIVPVYAVGQERGVHFYAMQFIEGPSLADVITNLRKSGGEARYRAPLTDLHQRQSAMTVEYQATASIPGSENNAAVSDQAPETVRVAATASTNIGGLSAYPSAKKYATQLKQIVRLGIQAAEALDHAHQMGVVHRDIKPGNLLVDGRGQLWITDFGLARLESNVELTMSGDLVGTLRYMSPEQALAKRGVIDHRTDIYSLGATLYETLTLEPVFDGEGRHELLHQISSEEPRSLRRVNRYIPGDLETIVLKCLAKQPEERYSTAQELANDLGRFLNDKPIQAKRPSFALRFSKWTKRHRSLVAAAVALLALAAIGLAVSNWFIWREQANTRRAYEAEAKQRIKLGKEEARTRRAYEAEAKQRKLAEENFRQARIILEYFTQVTEEELADIPRTQEVRRKMLEASLAYYKDFIRLSDGNLALQKELSDSHFHVAAILAEMGRKTQSLAAFENAARIHEQLVRSNPTDTGLQRDLTAVYQGWGMMKASGIIRLIGEESVQKDLKLPKEKRDAIQSLVDEHRGFFWKKRSGLPTERDKLMKEFDSLTKTTTQSIVGLLSAEQLRRLRQIDLQQSGVYAFKNREVVTHLKLSDSQQDAIKKILDDRRRSFKMSFPGSFKKKTFPQGKRPKHWNNPTARPDVDAIEKLLTGEQKAAWQQMIGVPFEGRIHRFRAFSGRGFRGRRGF